MVVANLFKTVDQFGKKLELNLHRKMTKNSVIGGVLTLIVVSIMIAYAAHNLHSKYIETYTWDIVSYTRRFQMKEDEPFYIHKDTGFLEGMRIEDYFDPEVFYEVDPSIGYFQT